MAIDKIGKLVKDCSLNWESYSPIPTENSSTIYQELAIPFPETALPVKDIEDKLQKLIAYSGYNGHPRFLAYITSSPDPVGVLATFLAAALNQNTNLWRIAPAATVIELQTIEWFKTIFKFPQQTEGVYSSGGQFANMIALSAARQYFCQDVREKGISQLGAKLRFYVSDQAHYCHRQALELLGLGTKALRIIPSDDNYRINLDLLTTAIKQDRETGAIPAVVIGTTGTVGCGAIDPISELAKIAKQEKLWFHIDGSYGALGILAEKAPSELHHINLGDSLVFDPHKWLYSPIDTAVTLVNHQGLLSQTFGNQVTYLEPSLSNQDSFDFVNLTPENSRPFRAIRVWLPLIARGINAFKESIENDFMLAKYMASLIDQHPSLELMTPTVTSIVCWRYLPTHQLTLERENLLHRRIIEEMAQRGIACISQALLHSNIICLRACFVNFRTTSDIVQEVVNKSAEIGQQIYEHEFIN
ncbi:MAG: aminotransferase class V-fold PLP-dependent enzyme [Moorea sp. SIO3H5]|nr:aminotransferase class V-fold PLP-dependent enzyme [Moorena sp. SIO3H5]